MSEQGLLRRHRHKIVPVLATLAALVLALVFWDELVAWFTGEPASGPPVTYDATAHAGGLEVAAALEPDAPRQEGNALHLRITEGGEPVEGAEVAVTYVMPAMGAMPEMRGEADVEESGQGRYVARFDLPMGGSWSLEVEARADERDGEVVFGMTVGTRGLTSASETAPAQPSIPPLPEHAFDEQPLGHLRAAFAAYEQARALLAADRAHGLAEVAGTIAEALRSAHETSTGAPSEVRSAIASGHESARALASQTELEPARRAFADLSQRLIGLADSDARLAEGYHVFRCPMVEHFPKWFQRAPSLENPYMGTRMLQCGVRTEWAVSEQPAAPTHAGDEVAYYTCPMHPSVRADDPSETCPICGMDLTPVTQQELETGVILVDEARRQAIGVRTAPIARRELHRQIRALGTVVYDQSRLHDVNLRMSGWVQQLRVAEPGARVRRGEVLFTLYSPELYAAQLEYITAASAPPLPELPAGSNAPHEASGPPPNALERAARQRLILLGMSEAQIRALRRRGEPSEAVPILSPASGWIVEKNVVEGAQVAAGTLVYRIADLDQVWIEVQVYESDLPHVRVGQDVRVTVPYLPDREFEGRVGFVYPYVDPETRTARVRIELENADLALRPDMYANAAFDVSLGEQLAVPMSAVIYTGPRRIVFVELGEGRLRPKVVELGARAGDYYVVRSGLDEGDVVVTSGNFLIAAESRLRSAAEYWGATDVEDAASATAPGEDRHEARSGAVPSAAPEPSERTASPDRTGARRPGARAPRPMAPSEPRRSPAGGAHAGH